MVSLSRAPKLDATARYTPVTSAATPAGIILEGHVYAGDDPRVVVTPSLFVRADAPTDELGEAKAAYFQTSMAQLPPEQSDARFTILREIPPERRVRATKALFFGNQLACHAGELRDSASEFVKQHKQFFIPDTSV